ncbi:MAG TPA: hypothetical protein VJO99_11615 [Burkholderiaceae bacterium]|nr:hypothetical protein [Burkholderiaceae bacterium]
MSNDTNKQILAELAIVDAERRRRAGDVALARRVQVLKAYQQRRFAHTYADLLATARYAPAARFFLDELYGPSDFTRRDAQFARVVPALVRLFPHEIVSTVRTLARLHALSETLDTETARRLPADGSIDAGQYISAWQSTGRADDRERQIVLTLEIASALDSLTRKVLIRNSLRLMRGPARAAGLNELQGFLENGFDTFRSMDGAAEFIRIVDEREHLLAQGLFQAQGVASVASLLPSSSIMETKR